MTLVVQERQLVQLKENSRVIHRLKGLTGKTACGKKTFKGPRRVTFGPADRVNCAGCKKAKP